MREILFRAKTKNSGRWAYGDLVTQRYNSRQGIHIYEKNDKMQSGYQFVRIDKKTICQYTGVKDKNNKEVYDGDIIYLEEEHLYGKVCWENLRWYVYWYGWIDKEGLGIVYDIVNENPLSDELLTSEDKIWVAVVGNIYDNPEMLKGENLYDY